MNHYHHFTMDEREKAMIMFREGMSISAIARALGRNKSSVSREFARNRKKNGEYSACHANRLYDRRRKMSRRKRLLDDTDLYNYVVERMCLYWTPEQIAGRAKLEEYATEFSYATIYRAVHSCLIPRSMRKLMRFFWKYKKKKEKDGRSSIRDAVSIHKRPAAANERSEIGHWESDTVLGQRKTGCFGTHVERRTGFLVAFRLDHRRDEAFAKKTTEVFASLPKELKKSFTVDNGTEFYSHKTLASNTQMDIYFCDPHAPWQRGTNENTNGLLRQFFPKGTSFAGISDDSLQHIVDLINNRPRKRYGFKTPAEVLALEIFRCT